jgi:plasmid stabilization system protein ParE
VKQLRFTPAADQDLIQIFDYIADTSGNNDAARGLRLSLKHNASG